MVGSNVPLKKPFIPLRTWCLLVVLVARYNVKRRLEKKPPVTEAAFNAMIEQQDDVSNRHTTHKAKI